MAPIAAHTGTVTVHGIHGDGTAPDAHGDQSAEASADADLRTLLDEYVGSPSPLAELRDQLGLREWTVQGRRLRDAATTLDGEVTFGFAGPEDLRLASYDRARPYLWCPPAALTVRRSNATFRTAAGCLVWSAEVRVLRIELQNLHEGARVELRERWRAQHR